MSCNWGGFIKSGDWYIHEPTRRASNSLTDLLSYEDVRHYLRFRGGFFFSLSLSGIWSCYHPESGIKSGDGFGDPMDALIDILTNDAFLKYLEDRVNG